MRRLRLGGETAQAMVEFVLLFPLLLFVVLILVEFGLVLSAYIRINNAASEAARYAAVGSAPFAGGACDSAVPSPSIEGLAARTSSGLITCDEVTVGYLKRMPDASYVRGDAVSIRIDHVHQLITPLGDFANAFSFGAFPNQLTMGACAESRLERGPVNQVGLPAGSSC